MMAQVTSTGDQMQRTTKDERVSEEHTAVLTQLVEKYLALHLHETAIFLCEKLHDIQRSEVSRHLLACCYVYSGRKAQAIEVLRGAHTPSNRYLRARYLMDLGRLGEAEEELTKHAGNLQLIFNERPPNHQQLDLIPNGSAGLTLLGKICMRSGRRNHAQNCFLTAHAHDPFLWEAYTQLCEMGTAGDALPAFGYDENFPFTFKTANDIYSHEFENATTFQQGPRDKKQGSTRDTRRAEGDTAGEISHFNRSIAFTSASEDLQRQTGAGSPLPSPVTPIDRLRWASPYGDIAYGSPSTPISQGGIPLQIPPQSGSVVDNYASQAASQQQLSFAIAPSEHCGEDQQTTTHRRHEYSHETKERVQNESHLSSNNRNVNQALSFHSEQSSFAQGGSEVRDNKSSQKLCTRLSFGAAATNLNDLSEIAEVNETKEVNVSDWRSEEAETTHSSVSNQAQGERSAETQRKQSHRRRGSLRSSFSKTSISHIRNILAQHAHIEHLISQVDLHGAIRGLFGMTPLLQKSAWWWYSLGRIYFAQSKYKQAKTALAKVRKVSPHYIEGCDLESTALWQLKDQPTLSHLAHELVAFDPHSCKTWAAVGNAFSLSEEHHTALQFLERCIQLDPQYAYAYTLRGHEFIAEEDLDAAAQSYRHAIRISPRQYNAWFGLGVVHYRQEQAGMAEVHFRKALSIFPQSPVLVCYLGMALHLAGKSEDAIETFNHCLHLEAYNTQAQLQLANVLKSLHRYEEARDLLQKCVRRAGQEPAVRVLLGQVCGALGDHLESLRHFNAALELAPKDANAIRVVLAKTLHGMHNEDSGDIEIAASPSFM
eukprot:gb/GECG01011192.1/.p1 GENE.gb/GECG01011192.1/~~gb/GECG01011192.1/.p1  ORF type:complete len:825 (+),score=80.59 gb/GECG01011192.1/:1-2475(+)